MTDLVLDVVCHLGIIEMVICLIRWCPTDTTSGDLLGSLLSLVVGKQENQLSESITCCSVMYKAN